MQIVHVITSLVRGGAESHVVELACGQAQRGAHVVVAYLKGDPYWLGTLATAGVRVVPLGMRRYGDPMPVARLVGLLKEVRPNVLHAHLPPAEVYARLALLAGGPALRFLISRHNEEKFFDGPGHRLLGTWIARRADAVIAISNAVARQTSDYLGVSQDRVRTIYYGIDPTPYFGAANAGAALRLGWRVPDDGLLIGTVCRFVPQKALDVLLAGYAHYRRKARQPSRLVMVGRGPLESALKDLASRLDLEDSVIWPGFREDIPEVMAALDTFALTSHYEGFGLVLLEAMAAAKPVIASNASAIPEVVLHDETGLLVPPDDPSAIAEAFCRIEDITLRQRLGKAGRERTVNLFTIDRMIDATLEVYREGAPRA